ncbi:MAG: 30S ribosomal protein S6 [Mariniblastus sp.]|nr:30S ribosomal protein S6 [Mariniblastus sp.]MDG1512086.1 30S ribosomal protein S6 [Mariniblastus sp.]MDG2183752.1 30S ribosomal protein S6 [Mariniblastus sp.]|eukprot:COSAG01_NODE_344_length_18545_cov_22.142958_12_plen_133_part_00
MAENVYECMFIFNANAYARNPAGAATAVDELVTSNGGEILASRLWNEQKLAYPIKGHRKGAYWLSYFRIDSSQLVKFNRACQLNDSILRHLAIKLDPRLVEPMVAVAKGETPAAEAPAEAKAEAKAETVAAE